MQHFDDLDPSLSESFKEITQIYAKNDTDWGFFCGLCSLTVITSRTIQRLYSKSITNLRINISDTMKDLNAQLEEWRRKVPLRIHSLYEPKESKFSTSLARVRLQLCYYQVLTLINRFPLLLEFQRSPDGQTLRWSHARSEPSETNLALEASICINAARETLKLVKDIPHKEDYWIWLVWSRSME